MEKSSADSLVSSSFVLSTSTTPGLTMPASRPRGSRASKAKDLVRNNQITTVSFPNPNNHSFIQYNALPTVQLCLSGELIDIPVKLLENEQTFRNIISKSAYLSLSGPARNYLKRFLPISTASKDNRLEEDDILNSVFTTNPNFCFGNPISKIFRRVKNGHFNAQHIADEVQLRGYHRVLYDHHIRHYYVNLLNKVLIARQVIMEHISTLGPHEKIVIHPSSFYSSRKLRRSRALQLRASIRAKKMIRNCQMKVGDFNISSDEDENEETSASSQFIPLMPGAESTIYSTKYSEHDFDLHQPIRMKDTKELFKEYRHLYETEPNCPSYDISDICLEEVYERAGVSFQSERNFATSFFEKTEQQRRDDVGAHISSSTPTLTTNSLSSED